MSNTIPFTFSARCDKSQDMRVNEILDYEMGHLQKVYGYVLNNYKDFTGTSSHFKTFLANKFDIQNHQAGYIIKRYESAKEAQQTCIKTLYLPQIHANINKLKSKQKSIKKKMENVSKKITANTETASLSVRVNQSTQKSHNRRDSKDDQ